jgi:hypothetical protein
VAGTFAVRRTRGAPRRWSAGAAATKAAWREMAPHEADRFLDIVVMISVALILLLATGVGILVLQSATR